MVPKNQSVPIQLVNLDLFPATVHKNTKIATAKLITDETICTAHESEPLITESDVLLHPLPPHITESQKEQFLALMSHYSCVIANSSDDLGCTQVMQHHIDTNGASPI